VAILGAVELQLLRGQLDVGERQHLSVDLINGLDNVVSLVADDHARRRGWGEDSERRMGGQ
jgi:hypothetical protein